MRILIINDHLNPSGGAETFINTLKINLEKKGHIVKLLGSKKGENLPSILSRWYSLKWYKRTKEEIKNFKLDIVHINNCVRVISPSVIDAALNSDMPVVLTFHDFHYLCHRLGGIYNENRQKRYLYRHKCFFPGCLGYDEDIKDIPRNLWKKAKLILHRKILKGKNICFIAPSQILAKSMEKFLEVPVKVINNGINIPEKRTKYEKIILFVGSLNEEKGFHKISSVLNNVKSYKVVVLGSGPLKKMLESKYKNIEFLGFQKPDNYYKKASIAVIPSIWMENFSYSVLEAMAYGLCVLGSDIGGIPEQIKDKQTGILFKRGNKKDFEEKLNYLLKNPKEIKKLGGNARKYARKNFSWDKITRKYEKVYLNAIRGN
ncbi:MAG: glycosyltransferase family 4 protein [Candidatus Pacearchaeota archaeon]|nr:glycosyltransferase family 4 protein [Candidatus Pacearchaeota archaeon]